MIGPTGNVTKSLTAAEVQAREEKNTLGPLTLSNGAATVLDSLVADNYQAAAWYVVLEKGTARLMARVDAYHDGTSSGDATDAHYSAVGPDDSGTVDVVLSCDVNGATTSQVMRLKALASSTGWKAYVWRVPMKPGQQ